MPTTQDIVLRPRFKIELSQSNQTILEAFQKTKTTQSDFTVTRIDDHVFIKFPKHKQHFWSPQLHLEVNEIDDHNCIIYGLFGPNPTVWTLFMFIHFLVAGLFIAFGIWAYTNWTLQTSYAIQIGMMLLMAVIWITLYLGGRVGKSSSKEEMIALRNFMNRVINEKSSD
ncbi:GTP-binding protein [Snuella sedimenti]|uniref:GTP-binding protein n=1 Tax=Snuella sedimenti TaxID=2798802 RepID=A0A8J7J5V5_9FLAO|nr:GTP-binding protein [Snuella sedimenti]MBJ6369089.1 GTP-binding protein [Snuella sedimenti]